MTEHPGDTTERWRQSYRRVRKDLISDPQSTNRARLVLLGVDALARDAQLLDLGAGDGNLLETLRSSGFVNVWGLEYQAELAALHARKDRVVIASGAVIPFASSTMAAVIVMDVLHHLTLDQIPQCLAEIRRVLVPRGLLYVCEPSSTWFRKLMSLLLMSPLSRLSRFAQDKRAMVEQERATLEPWLACEDSVESRIEAAGFRKEFFRRCWLHHYGRFRSIDD